MHKATLGRRESAYLAAKLRSASHSRCSVSIALAIASALRPATDSLEQNPGAAASGFHAAGAHAHSAGERHGHLPPARSRAAADQRNRSHSRRLHLRAGRTKPGSPIFTATSGAPVEPRPKPAIRWTTSWKRAPPRSRPTISPTRPPSRSNCLKGDFDAVFEMYLDLLHNPEFREDKLRTLQAADVHRHCAAER